MSDKHNTESDTTGESVPPTTTNTDTSDHSDKAITEPASAIETPSVPVDTDIDSLSKALTSNRFRLGHRSSKGSWRPGYVQKNESGPSARMRVRPKANKPNSSKSASSLGASSEGKSPEFQKAVEQHLAEQERSDMVAGTDAKSQSSSESSEGKGKQIDTMDTSHG